MRGLVVPAGNVYLWSAVLRVEVSSTRTEFDYSNDAIRKGAGRQSMYVPGW